MNRFHSKYLAVLCLLLLVAATMFTGCKGSDGATGATGPTGPAGPVTETGESCNVCHSTDRTADITNYHPAMYTQKLSISNMVVSSSLAGEPTVAFHVDVTSGGTTTYYAGMTASAARFYIADLVPANTVSSPTGTLVSNLTGTLSTAKSDRSHVVL